MTTARKITAKRKSAICSLQEHNAKPEDMEIYHPLKRTSLEEAHAKINPGKWIFSFKMRYLKVH